MMPLPRARNASKTCRTDTLKRSKCSFENIFPSVDRLPVSKLEWAKESRSEMQLADVRNLLSVPDLDRTYLLRWSQALGIESLYREVAE